MSDHLRMPDRVRMQSCRSVSRTKFVYQDESDDLTARLWRAHACAFESTLDVGFAARR